MEFSLKGIGVSFVDNFAKIEVMYMTITNSDVVWEQSTRGRFSTMPSKMARELERCYTDWLAMGKPIGTLQRNSTEIDFNNWLVRRNNTGVTEVRRLYENGLWFQYRRSNHQTQLHVKINHLQVDNQMPACRFRCALVPIAQKKTLASDEPPKPFAEFKYVLGDSERPNVVQVKQLQLLLQEFAIRVDSGLHDAIVEMFSKPQGG